MVACWAEVLLLLPPWHLLLPPLLLVRWVGGPGEVHVLLQGVAAAALLQLVLAWLLGSL